MGKNKKVFVEAVSEMKHFLLGAALVLTVVAVVPALAQTPPPGGSMPPPPPMSQPSAPAPTAPAPAPTSAPAPTTAPTGTYTAPTAPAPAPTSAPAPTTAPTGTYTAPTGTYPAPTTGAYPAPTTGAYPAPTGGFPGSTSGALPGSTTGGTSATPAGDCFNSSNVTVFGSPACTQARAAANDAKTVPPYNMPTMRPCAAGVQPTPAAPCMLSPEQMKTMQNNMGGQTNMGGTPMPGTAADAAKMYEQQNPGKTYTPEMAKEFENMKSKGPMMNYQTGHGMNSQNSQMGGQMGTQGMNTQMGGKNSFGGIPTQMGSQMGGQMGTQGMNSSMDGQMGGFNQGMGQGMNSQYSPAARFGSENTAPFSFGPQSFGRQGKGGKEQEFQGPTPEEQAAQEDEMRAKFESQMNAQRLGEMKRGVKQALSGIAQGEKQLAKLAAKGCAVDAEVTDAITKMKASLTAISTATSADDVDFDAFQEMGDLKGSVEEALHAGEACLNAKPLQKAATKAVGSEEKKTGYFLILNRLENQAKKNSAVEGLAEEAKAIVDAAKVALAEGDDSLTSGDYVDASDSYQTVFEARAALDEVQFKAEIAKSLKKAPAQFTGPVTEIARRIADAKKARRDVGTIKDGQKQLVACVASLKTVSAAKDADVDEVFAKVDECNSLISALNNGLDQVFGINSDYQGIQGVEDFGNVDLGVTFNGLVPGASVSTESATK